MVKAVSLPKIPLTESAKTAFLMALIGGFVDLFGFIALEKLFTSHITGNIIIAIAETISHSEGLTEKLVALPVFIFVAMLTTWIIEHFGQTKKLLAILFLVEIAFLSVFMITGHFIIPLTTPKSASYITVGMLAVSAMAIHNILVRTFMSSFPACTVMTTNFCQWLIALVSYFWGQRLSYPVETLAASLDEMRRFGNVLFAFCIGGVLAGVGFTTIGFWSMSLPIAVLLFLTLQILNFKTQSFFNIPISKVWRRSR